MLPVFYTPYLYRDFRLDYPWTRYEFGGNSRLGVFGRGWTRLDLPPLANWRTRITAQAHWYERVGVALGVQPSWHHDSFGSGRVLWFGFDEEEVRRDADTTAPLEKRTSYIVDGEHHISFPGGSVFARYTRLPDADAGENPDERFRADYLEDELETKTLARQGVGAAWSTAWLSLYGSIDQRPNDTYSGYDTGTIKLALPQTQVFQFPKPLPIGLHLYGAGSLDWVSETTYTADGNGQVDETIREAQRLHFATGIGFTHWFQTGFSWDADVTAVGTRYTNGSITAPITDTLTGGETDFEDQHRILPQFTTGVAVRFESQWQSKLVHTITPRIGLRVNGTASGDELSSDWDFDPNPSLPQADTRYLETELATLLAGKSPLFRADITALWALRKEDAPLEDNVPFS